MQVYLNGSFIDHEKAKVSAFDRGFIFGDGVYEVIRVINNHFFREKEHLDRLDYGLQGLSIHLKPEIRKRIPEIARDLITKNKLERGEATVYLQVTRGASWPRTHTFPEPMADSTVYLSAGPFKPHKELHEKGVGVIKIPDIRWSRCDLKTVNLLPNTLARQRAKEQNKNSAILVRDGVVTESPNANIFAVKDGVLRTFPESNYILSGITREVVCEIAQGEKTPLIEKPVTDEELETVDELFFTGTTTDIQPITEIDGRPVGNGEPGPVTRQIQKRYSEMLYGND